MSGAGDDHGGVGRDVSDAPRLPDAAPTPLPYLPEAPRPVVEPEPEPEFDAKAMVESQRVKANAKPGYGGMPTAKPDSHEAVEQLRAAAKKKRRRNTFVARFAVAVLFGGALVAGYFVYEAFQDEEAARNGDTEEGVTDDDSASDDGDREPAALTPLGEQSEVIAGMDILSGGATGSAGGFLDAVDDARAAVDDLNDVDPAADAPAPAAPDALPGTIDAAILRYDLGSVADPVVHHVVADLATDTYVIASEQGGELLRAAETGPADVARYDVASGLATRASRSDASLAAGPDALFVSAVSPGVLLPPSAEPHARPTSVGLTGIDGQPVVGEAYVVDVEAFRDADAASADAWLTVLQFADPTAALGEGMPNLDTDLLDARNTIDEMTTRVDAGVVSGSPPVALASQVIIGWTQVEGQPYVRAAYAASGDGAFQWLYRVTAVDQPPVAVFGVP